MFIKKFVSNSLIIQPRLINAQNGITSNYVSMKPFIETQSEVIETVLPFLPSKQSWLDYLLIYFK